ncbi:hypothetical protein CW712_00285 [Candidatus Bathyarchaeota archaeon]|nr:MAG: hypothetical protein CW712_00285 [Candidatus Bathyarchaeota archaeon]
MRLLGNRKGLAPVVATIILCGVVLTIGISVWSLTYSISSGLELDYYESVKRQIDKVSERFTVEHVAYDNDTNTLRVWVYNYGTVDINVDVYVFFGSSINGSNTNGTSISSGNYVEIPVSVGELNVGSELVIEVISRRQNTVYATYVVQESS